MNCEQPSHGLITGLFKATRNVYTKPPLTLQEFCEKVKKTENDDWTRGTLLSLRDYLIDYEAFYKTYQVRYMASCLRGCFFGYMDELI